MSYQQSTKTGEKNNKPRDFYWFTLAAVSADVARRTETSSSPEVAASRVGTAAPEPTVRPKAPCTTSWTQKVTERFFVFYLILFLCSKKYCSVPMSWYFHIRRPVTYVSHSVTRSNLVGSCTSPSQGGTVPGPLNTGTVGCTWVQTSQQDSLGHGETLLLHHSH